MKLFTRILEVLDGFEAAFVVLLGTALFIGLAVVVPSMLAWALLTSGQALLGSLFLVLVVLTTFGVARDVRLKRWSWLTGALTGLWLLCVGFVSFRILLA